MTCSSGVSNATHGPLFAWYLGMKKFIWYQLIIAGEDQVNHFKMGSIFFLIEVLVYKVRVFFLKGEKYIAVVFSSLSDHHKILTSILIQVYWKKVLSICYMKQLWKRQFKCQLLNHSNKTTTNIHWYLAIGVETPMMQ